jgi:hypothetical protein
VQFLYQPIPTLPPLAWCARIEHGNAIVAVLHGGSVETRPGAFVEGAWNADFAALDLTGATVVAGTGGIAERDRVRFSASTDTCSPLFTIGKAASTYVSNSPAFVMAVAAEAPDDMYPFYPYDLLRIYRQGLRCSRGQLALYSGAGLGVHFSTIVSVDAQGRVTFDRHPLCEPPTDYRSYKAQLLDAVSKVIENAKDPSRKRSYRPLASLSRGYDSCASVALAKPTECTETFTFTDSRQKASNSDSGAEIARYLGVTCQVYERWRYLDLDGCAEAEFGYVATASMVPLATSGNQFRGRLLIVGDSGGSIWDPRRAWACDELSRAWMRHTLGLSSIEFRLRVGYIAFAPPGIAARHNRRIHAIALGEEMRPWSVGGDYDRPIPRRIAEEAGLPRESFGMLKLASAHTHLIYPSRFSPNALQDYRDFVARRHAAIPRDVGSYWRMRAQRRHAAWSALEIDRGGDPDAIAHEFPPSIRIPWNFMFTFQWAVASVRGRYAVPVSKPG